MDQQAEREAPTDGAGRERPKQGGRLLPPLDEIGCLLGDITAQCSYEQGLLPLPSLLHQQHRPAPRQLGERACRKPSTSPAPSQPAGCPLAQAGTVPRLFGFESTSSLLPSAPLPGPGKSKTGGRSRPRGGRSVGRRRRVQGAGEEAAWISGPGQDSASAAERGGEREGGREGGAICGDA